MKIFGRKVFPETLDEEVDSLERQLPPDETDNMTQAQWNEIQRQLRNTYKRDGKKRQIPLHRFPHTHQLEE